MEEIESRQFILRPRQRARASRPRIAYYYYYYYYYYYGKFQINVILISRANVLRVHVQKNEYNKNVYTVPY